MSMTALPRVNDAQLGEIANYLRRPISQDFAANRYTQDVQALLGEVLALRRTEAETLRGLRELPLEDMELTDGIPDLVRKAQDMWLAYQRGVWTEKEGARLKKAAERADKATQAALAQVERLNERVAGLEAAYAEAQALIASLTAQARELTDNLASTSAREAAHSNRVRILESERVDLERQHNHEMNMTRAASEALEAKCADRTTKAADLLTQAVDILRS